MEKNNNDKLKSQSKYMMGLFSFMGIFLIATIVITSFNFKGTYSAGTCAGRSQSECTDGCNWSNNLGMCIGTPNESPSCDSSDRNDCYGEWDESTCTCTPITQSCSDKGLIEPSDCGYGCQLQGVCCVVCYDPPESTPTDCRTGKDSDWCTADGYHVDESTCTCVHDFIPGCYTAANKYQWFSTQPANYWTRVDSVSQNNCSGCISGYHEETNDNGTSCVVDTTPSTGRCSGEGEYSDAASCKAANPGWNCTQVDKGGNGLAAYQCFVKGTTCASDYHDENGSCVKTIVGGDCTTATGLKGKYNSSGTCVANTCTNGSQSPYACSQMANTACGADKWVGCGVRSDDGCYSYQCITNTCMNYEDCMDAGAFACVDDTKYTLSCNATTVNSQQCYIPSCKATSNPNACTITFENASGYGNANDNSNYTLDCKTDSTTGKLSSDCVNNLLSVCTQWSPTRWTGGSGQSDGVSPSSVTCKDGSNLVYYCVAGTSVHPPTEPSGPSNPTNPENPDNPTPTDPDNPTVSENCYRCNIASGYTYIKTTSVTKAAESTDGSNCSIVADSYCHIETSTNCYECDVNGKKEHVMADSEDDAKTKKGASSCTIVTTDKCNISTNPKTGTVAIIVAWLIGIATFVYAGWYFVKSKSLNK